MPILNVNFNASINDIILGHISGEVRSYLVRDGQMNKTDILVTLADKLANLTTTSFVEVKFKSEYSQRAKRIEVVTKSGHDISIYKISNEREYDKDSLELSRVCTELEATYNDFRFIPYLYMRVTEISFFQESITEMGLHVIIKSL